MPTCNRKAVLTRLRYPRRPTSTSVPVRSDPRMVSTLPKRTESFQNTEFRTIRYLGNKRKLTDNICAAIEDASSVGNHVIDLFAGSCSVSYQVKRTHQVRSDDND